MSQRWTFDEDHYSRLTESRKAFLDELLSSPLVDRSLNTAVDLGCGLGVFSSYLAARGMSVTGVDARTNNVEEARRRYPEIAFRVVDIEDTEVVGLGIYDLVLCFGLLYHLENPFRAIRNLHALTGKVALIEALVAPDKRAVAHFRVESTGEDQGLRHQALVPSESCLIKMLYAAGFARVYTPTLNLKHEDFKSSFVKSRRRKIFVASTELAVSPHLVEVAEPNVPEIWGPGLRARLSHVRDFPRRLASKFLK